MPKHNPTSSPVDSLKHAQSEAAKASREYDAAKAVGNAHACDQARRKYEQACSEAEAAYVKAERAAKDKAFEEANPALYPEFNVPDDLLQPRDGESPVIRHLEYPAHLDPDVELLLALEAVIERAVEEGANQTQIACALEYTRARPRRYPHFAREEPQPQWPADDELPKGPYLGDA